MKSTSPSVRGSKELADKGGARGMGILAIILALLGIGLLYASFAQYRDVRAFLEEATRTEGTVVKFRETRTTEKSPETNYIPLIHYTTQHGKEIEFVGSTATNPPSYSVGQKVGMFYRQARPQDARIDDFESLWGAAALIGGIGGVLLLMGALMMLVAAVKRHRATL